MAEHTAVTDYLLALTANGEVSAQCNRARDALDAAVWDRGLARAHEDFWTGVRRYCGYASASLDGGQMPSDPLTEPDGSAMGKLALAALMVTAEADVMAGQVRRTPNQVWARLSSIVDDTEDRGRPRGTDDVRDPLHLGPAPSAEQVADRLASLTEVLVSSEAPVVLVAGIAHAELAVLRPFSHGSYVIARSAPRMVLAAGSLDVKGAAAVEAGFASQGRARYVRALQDYTRGSIAEYMAYFADSVVAGLAVTGSLHRNQGFAK